VLLYINLNKKMNNKKIKLIINLLKLFLFIIILFYYFIWWKLLMLTFNYFLKDYTKQIDIIKQNINEMKYITNDDTKNILKILAKVKKIKKNTKKIIQDTKKLFNKDIIAFGYICYKLKPIINDLKPLNVQNKISKEYNNFVILYKNFYKENCKIDTWFNKVVQKLFNF